MKKLRFLLVTVVVACSPAFALDYDKAFSEVEKLTLRLGQMMTDGREAEVYDSLMHEAVKEKVPIDNFHSIASKLSKKLGRLKSISSNRLDLNPTKDGLLARGIYVGTFERGKADISIIALNSNGQWSVTRFNANSPLLYDDRSEYKRRVEVYVVDSDFVLPGQKVVLMGKNNLVEDELLSESIQVLRTRWKVSISDRKEGFVTLALSEKDQELIKKFKDITLRKQ